MISADIFEETLLNESSSKRNGLNIEQFESALGKIGIVMTSREIQTIFVDINRSIGSDDTSRIQANEIIKYSKRGSSSSSPGKSSSKNKRSDENRFDVLLPDVVIEDISQSIQAFLKISRVSLSHVVTSFQARHDNSRSSSNNSNSSSNGKMNKSQFLKFLEHVGCQLEETYSNLLFEIFDIYGEGSISSEYVSLYFYTISTVVDTSYEAASILLQICQKRRLNVKDFMKNLLPYDVSKKGFITVESFETTLKKLAGTRPGLTSSQLSDILKYFDPSEENRIDLGVFQTFITMITDSQKVEDKLKHYLKLMRIKEFSYQEVFEAYPSQINCDELIEICNKLQLPLIEAEINTLFSRVCDKNKQITTKSFLQMLEMEGNEGNSTSRRLNKLLGSKSPNELKEDEFCKTMYQKLCKLRSNNTKCDQFREGIMSRDPDLNGRITTRELQRTIEKYVDFTEAEFNLLAENLCFIDGNFKKDIDYSFLLLLLYEPINKQDVVMELGRTIMTKMLRNDDSVSLRRLIALLFRNFASDDDRKCGMITIGSGENVLKEECQNTDPKHLRKLLSAFQDTSSDCILYPELLSFLSSCSVWNVMYRLHLVDKIRKKQGYNISDYLLKTTAKNKYRLSKERFFDIFLKIGILMTDTALETIYQKFRIKDEEFLDTKAFVKGLNELESSDNPNDDNAPVKKDRKDISTWEQNALTTDGKCQIKETLLKKYDTRMLKAIDLAFDLFDQNSKNEIAALDIERVLCALGQKPSPTDIEELLSKIDPNGTDLLEYNTFMDVVLPYIRGKYEETFLPSLQKLQEAFRIFDYNKDGSVSTSEFRYILSLQSEDVSENEAEALLELLDTDENGSVEWAEFSELYNILQDEDAILQLNVPARSALRKVN